MDKKLHKSNVDKKIAGVCGGIAETYGWDVSTVRFVAALLVLFAGGGLIAFILAAIILPEGEIEQPEDEY